MDRKKKKLIILLLLAVVLTLLIVCICLWNAGVFSRAEPTQPTDQTATTATTIPTESSSIETSVPETTTSVTTKPTTEATEPTVSKKPSKPATVVPPTTVPATTPTEPKATDPAAILDVAKSQIKNLSGDIKEVVNVENPKTLTIQVGAMEDVQAAAKVIVDQVKSTLAYEQSQANPNVAVGNPNPFTYEYNLSFVSTGDGKHTFRFDYRFISTSYEVSNQNYDTGKLVKDVCAYLDGLGKAKFDSQTEAYASSQPVIVLMEHPYDTALSIVKAQVESASAKYRNYDFYYAALTVTTKGGVEQEALLFYIVNK